MENTNNPPDLMETLTARYLSPGSNADHQMLDQDQTWCLIKVISSLVRVETNRQDAIRAGQTTWEGFTVTPEEFENRMINAGINNLPNLGDRGQTPQFIARLHALYLEKTSNSLGLLRLVDAAVNDAGSDEGKKLKGIGIYMNKEDPVMAIESLCTKVILTCTFISSREKLAREVSSTIDQYEAQRGELMEISHGSMDGNYPPPPPNSSRTFERG